MEQFKIKMKKIGEKLSFFLSLKFWVMTFTLLQFIYPALIAGLSLLCTYTVFLNEENRCRSLMAVFFCIPLLILETFTLILTLRIFLAIRNKKVGHGVRNRNIVFAGLKLGALYVVISFFGSRLGMEEWIFVGVDAAISFFYFILVQIYYWKNYTCNTGENNESEMSEEEKEEIFPIVPV